MCPTKELALTTPLVALLTDFGSSDHYVGVLKGVIAAINPRARVVDISHEIQPHAVKAASYLLWASHRFFPGNSVFVIVVDPGVGSNRKILAARTRKYWFVAPDNGVLDLVRAEEAFVECHVVNVEHSPFVLNPVSGTFHGRDVLAPVAAYLANGVPCSEFGPAYKMRNIASPFVASTNDGTCSVLHCDRFGNIVTSIRNEMFELLGAIKVKESTIAEKVRFYQEGTSMKPCLIKGSSGLVEIVLKEGSAARLLSVQPETSLKIQWR